MEPEELEESEVVVDLVVEEAEESGLGPDMAEGLVPVEVLEAVPAV